MSLTQLLMLLSVSAGSLVAPAVMAAMLDDGTHKLVTGLFYTSYKIYVGSVLGIKKSWE